MSSEMFRLRQQGIDHVTRRREKTGRGAYTLIEMSVVLIVMGILITMAMPKFSRSLESAKADVAGANLRAIWTAERIYWLDNRSYTTSLDLLVSLNLLDPSITSTTPNPYYSYSVTEADTATFTATAQRSQCHLVGHTHDYSGH